MVSDLYIHLHIIGGHYFSAKDKKPFHDVAKLADISAPGAILKHRDSFRAEGLARKSRLLAYLRCEIVYKKRYVVLTLIERRNIYYN